MAWLKRDFVTQAFEEIGYASYVYDAMPEQLESVLKSLDAMMASWNANGIKVGYPISSSFNDASLDEKTGVPDSANEAIYLNLAIRIGPRFGKQIAQETKQAAKQALDALLVKISLPPEMQFSITVPSGAGNKARQGNRRPFLNQPVDPLLSGQDDTINFT